MRFNNYTGWGEALAYLMILCYFTILLMESRVGLAIPELYNLFTVMFKLPLVWLQLISSAVVALALEFGWFYVA